MRSAAFSAIAASSASSTPTATPLLRPVDVAELCRCSVKTVMRAIIATELEASQLGQRGTWVIRESAVEEWLDQRSNRVRPPRPLVDVRRVDGGPQAFPAPVRGNRTRAPTGSGRLVA
jgi:excisionase family DNA binding protein